MRVPLEVDDLQVTNGVVTAGAVAGSGTGDRPAASGVRATTASGALPVDLAHLRRFTFGDLALEKEVLLLFVTQLPETLAALRSAACERDWRMAAHTLKGSSRAVGAWRIASLAQDAESLSCGSDPEACEAAISRLENAASETQTFIDATYRQG
jgi:HPt (histidine-containing phosphotransfer) domain-containing protein